MTELVSLTAFIHAFAQMYMASEIVHTLVESIIHTVYLLCKGIIQRGNCDPLVSRTVPMTRSGVSLHHTCYRHGLFDGWPCTTGRVVVYRRLTRLSPCHRSFPFPRHLRLAFMFRCALLWPFLLLTRVLGHDVLKVTP